MKVHSDMQYCTVLFHASPFPLCSFTNLLLKPPHISLESPFKKQKNWIYEQYEQQLNA
jgi:hypothetical protein